MSQEKTLKNLENLGFSKIEAQIYLLLGKKGPKRAKDIVTVLKVNRQRLYEILKEMEKKGLINNTLEHPAKFGAEPFEKLLDLFIKSKKVEAERLEDNRLDFLTDWKSIAIQEIDNVIHEKFSVIEGRNNVYSKIVQMTEETKDQLLVNLPFEDIVRVDQNNFLDLVFKRASKIKPAFRLLVESSNQNTMAIKKYFNGKPKTMSGFEFRILDSGLRVSNPMIIRDKFEVLIFINNNDAKKEDMFINTCLWTNCKSIVDSFSYIFEDFWQNSTEIDKKIKEASHNESETQYFKDNKITEEKYNDAIGSADSEILIVTSSEGLVQLSQNKMLMKKATNRGTIIRLLAPITCENLESAMKLIGICEVRDGPPGWLMTTIIDNKVLFQAKNLMFGESGENDTILYTNEPGHVETTRNLIIKLWKNARIPSYKTLKSILDNIHTYDRTYKEKLLGEVVYEAPPGKIKESDILNKIFTGKKYPAPKEFNDVVRHYGSAAIGIIYPPKNLNLPELLFNVLKCNKQSSFGVEDWIIISLRTETKQGSKYAPVVYVTDNPKTAKFRTTFFKASVQIMKEHELQVHVQGNSLFAGWTTPISLPMIGKSIPPSALMFEGFGKITSSAVTRLSQSGRKQEVEYNRMEARFTFFHPSSNYSGPGIDGFFDREMIFTSYPKNSQSIN